MATGCCKDFAYKLDNNKNKWLILNDSQFLIVDSYTVPKKEAVSFTRDSKVSQATVKVAVEKALTYLEKDELPAHWDRDILFGNHVSDDPDLANDTESDVSFATRLRARHHWKKCILMSWQDMQKGFRNAKKIKAFSSHFQRVIFNSIQFNLLLKIGLQCVT